jgi:aerobic C4-dicarboxylate transport protein
VQVLLPAGFSFNLNGSSIYLTLTLMFLAQASQVAIAPAQLATIILVAMVASKGASGIAGSSFVILGSLALLVPGIAPESLALVFSIERLLKCRSLANVIGNAVGCIAILHWMGHGREKSLEMRAVASIRQEI